MCGGSDDGPRFPELLRDPLIQMVMRSDGVTEQHIITFVGQLRRTPAAREHRICSDTS